MVENMSWSLGLKNTIRDISNHLISSNIGVVIQDKYPKAKNHFLILPKDDISSIFNLNATHLKLLDELHLLAVNIIEVKQYKLEDFKIGFHAEPSMQQLHMHVISKDFVSDCLKTKKHWNSFNTKFFIPYEVLYDELNANGCIKRWEKEEIKFVLDSKLHCNQCEFIGKNIPTLKEHLFQHWQQRINII